MSDLPQRKKRLLVIDDDDSLRDLFRFTMEKAGYQVGEAADGNLGLQQAQEFEPDLIVVDLMMPNLNGFEVISNLQALGLGKIPVVVVTGYSDKSGQELVGKEPNVIAFMQKPIKYEDLIVFVRDFLVKKP